MNYRRVCPLCGGAPGRVTFPHETNWEGSAYAYRRCMRCRTVFLVPVPTEDQLDRIYDWDSYHMASPEVTSAHFDHTVKEVESVTPPGGKILDFGCGDGSFLERISGRGYELYGVERNARVADRVATRTGIPVVGASALPDLSIKFDVILLRDVLPHLPSPQEALETLEGTLAVSGLFLVDGPLDEQLTLNLVFARCARLGKKLARRSVSSHHPPTMLYRANAPAQRAFFTDRMGYREDRFGVYGTGWPYYTPGRKPTTLTSAVKMGIGATSGFLWRIPLSEAHKLGNRFTGVYRPRRYEAKVPSNIN